MKGAAKLKVTRKQMRYLFVPARGPVVAMTDVISEPLQGGFFLAVVMQAVEAVGGPHGAFPSLHVGVSCLITLFDLRHGNPLRGLIYVPLVVLICVATVAQEGLVRVRNE